jgi:penicillin V acylase-like amidase (Ntn superfamily)
MRALARLLTTAVVVLLAFSLTTPSFLRFKTDSLGRNFTDEGRGCSGFCLRNNGYALYGGNMDWNIGDRGYIYLNKRGLQKTGLYRNNRGETLHWVSKYASITFNLVGYQNPWGGMNEKGLAFSTMSLLPYTLAPVDERMPMDGPHGMQYLLDTCETIDEIIAACSSLNMYMAEHYLVTDRYGNCAVMESINGDLVFYTGDNLPVAALTNTGYEESLDTWYEYRGSPDHYNELDQSRRRFCKAADRVSDFNSLSTDSAVAYAFDTLDTIAGERNGEHISQWRVVLDTKNLRAYFKTFHHPAIRYIDLRRLDLAGDSPVKMLDIRRELAGDVTAYLTDFEYTPSWEHMRWFYDEWGIDAPDSEVERRMQILTNHPYVGDDTSEAFLASRYIEKINSLPRTALNPETGDVLVVWTRYETAGSAGAIYSALLTRSITGGYSSIEEHALSEGGGTDDSPFPVFDPNKKQFLVVWNHAASVKPSSACDIQGRILSATGLPEGDVFKVFSNGGRNESPQIYIRPVGTAIPSPGSLKAQLYLLFGSDEPIAGSSGRVGLYASRLSGKYKAGKPRLLMSYESGWRVFPGGLGRVVGGDLVLPVEIKTAGAKGRSSSQVAVVVIEGFKRLADSEYLGTVGAARPSLIVFENSFEETVVVGSVVQNGALVNKAMRFDASGQSPKLTPTLLTTEPKQIVDSLLLPVYGASSDSSLNVSSASRMVSGYLISAAADGKVYRRALLEKGRTGGAYKELFLHEMSLNSMCGQGISIANGATNDQKKKQDEYFIIWEKRLSDTQHQIRANLIRVNH